MSSFSLTCPMDPAENFLKTKKLLYGSPKGEHSKFASPFGKLGVVSKVEPQVLFQKPV